MASLSLAMYVFFCLGGGYICVLWLAILYVTKGRIKKIIIVSLQAHNSK